MCQIIGPFRNGAERSEAVWPATLDYGQICKRLPSDRFGWERVSENFTCLKPPGEGILDYVWESIRFVSGTPVAYSSLFRVRMLLEPSQNVECVDVTE